MVLRAEGEFAQIDPLLQSEDQGLIEVGNQRAIEDSRADRILSLHQSAYHKMETPKRQVFRDGVVDPGNWRVGRPNIYP